MDGRTDRHLIRPLLARLWRVELKTCAINLSRKKWNKNLTAKPESRTTVYVCVLLWWKRRGQEVDGLFTRIDFGNAERMLYNSGVLTLNNAMTMLCEVCRENTHQQLPQFQTTTPFFDMNARVTEKYVVYSHTTQSYLLKNDLKCTPLSPGSWQSKAKVDK